MRKLENILSDVSDCINVLNQQIIGWANLSVVVREEALKMLKKHLEELSKATSLPVSLLEKLLEECKLEKGHCRIESCMKNKILRYKDQHLNSQNVKLRSPKPKM
ncbi:hypothetical protein [Vibrio harveyi]